MPSFTPEPGGIGHPVQYAAVLVCLFYLQLQTCLTDNNKAICKQAASWEAWRIWQVLAEAVAVLRTWVATARVNMVTAMVMAMDTVTVHMAELEMGRDEQHRAEKQARCGAAEIKWQ